MYCIYMRADRDAMSTMYAMQHPIHPELGVGFRKHLRQEYQYLHIEMAMYIKYLPKKVLMLDEYSTISSNLSKHFEEIQRVCETETDMQNNTLRCQFSCIHGSCVVRPYVIRVQDEVYKLFIINFITKKHHIAEIVDYTRTYISDLMEWWNDVINFQEKAAVYKGEKMPPTLFCAFSKC